MLSITDTSFLYILHYDSWERVHLLSAQYFKEMITSPCTQILLPVFLT